METRLLRAVLTTVGILLCCAGGARADIVTEPVVYEHEGTTLEGYLARDARMVTSASTGAILDVGGTS